MKRSWLSVAALFFALDPSLALSAALPRFSAVRMVSRSGPSKTVPAEECASDFWCNGTYDTQAAMEYLGQHARDPEGKSYVQAYLTLVHADGLSGRKAEAERVRLISDVESGQVGVGLPGQGLKPEDVDRGLVKALDPSQLAAFKSMVEIEGHIPGSITKYITREDYLNIVLRSAYVRNTRSVLGWADASVLVRVTVGDGSGSDAIKYLFQAPKIGSRESLPLQDLRVVPPIHWRHTDLEISVDMRKLGKEEEEQLKPAIDAAKDILGLAVPAAGPFLPKAEALAKALFGVGKDISMVQFTRGFRVPRDYNEAGRMRAGRDDLFTTGNVLFFNKKCEPPTRFDQVEKAFDLTSEQRKAVEAHGSQALTLDWVYGRLPASADILDGSGNKVVQGAPITKCDHVWLVIGKDQSPVLGNESLQASYDKLIADVQGLIESVRRREHKSEVHKAQRLDGILESCTIVGHHLQSSEAAHLSPAHKAALSTMVGNIRAYVSDLKNDRLKTLQARDVRARVVSIKNALDGTGAQKLAFDYLSESDRRLLQYLIRAYDYLDA